MNIIKILGIAAGAAALGLAGLAALNPGNSAETSEEAGDDFFKTRFYQTDFDAFVEEAAKLISSQFTYGQNWKLIKIQKPADSDNQTETAIISAEVPVLFFTDDLEISITGQAQPDTIRVDVRSTSRVGKSDLGENKRHVAQILTAMDEKFSKK